MSASMNITPRHYSFSSSISNLISSRNLGFRVENYLRRSTLPGLTVAIHNHKNKSCRTHSIPTWDPSCSAVMKPTCASSKPTSPRSSIRFPS